MDFVRRVDPILGLYRSSSVAQVHNLADGYFGGEEEYAESF